MVLTMATPTATTKTPTKLTGREWIAPTLLAGCGLLLVVGTLAVYGWRHTEGTEKGFITKITKVTEAIGTKPKVTTTTEYGETMVIFALTIGAAMLLCAAFYTRIREIKVEGIDLTLAEGTALDKGVDSAVKARAPDKQAAMAPLAKVVARQHAYDALLSAPRGLTPAELEEIGHQAVDQLLTLQHAP
jgi:hypothetical protein